MGDVPGQAIAPEPVIGHPPTFAGGFGTRVVCRGCGMICLYNYDLEAWIGVDVDLARAAADEAYNPVHVYAPAAFTRHDDGEPAQDAPGPDAEPVRHSAALEPIRECEDPVPDMTQAEAARRRKAAGRPPIFPGATGRRSKFSRTPEYRRVERLRIRARQKGLDPNKLGPRYRLPKRDDKILQEYEDREVARLIATGARAGLNTAAGEPIDGADPVED